MKEEALEPPFTKAERLGNANAKLVALVSALGAMIDTKEPRMAVQGKLWNIRDLVEEINSIRYQASTGVSVNNRIENLPKSPVDIRDLVKQIVELEAEIVAIKNED